MAAFAFIARECVSGTIYPYPWFLSHYISWVYNFFLFLWSQMWTILRKKSSHNFIAWYFPPLALIFLLSCFSKGMSHESIFQPKSKALSLQEKLHKAAWLWANEVFRIYKGYTCIHLYFPRYISTITQDQPRKNQEIFTSKHLISANDPKNITPNAASNLFHNFP